jgi:hypothetical protein
LAIAIAGKILSAGEYFPFGAARYRALLRVSSRRRIDESPPGAHISEDHEYLERALTSPSPSVNQRLTDARPAA